MKETISMLEKGHESFKGVSFENEYGSIEYPIGAHIAELEGPSFEKVFTGSKESRYEFKIHKPALEGVLIEVDGANVFRIAQGRFAVLAKVGNIHLPFYISSAGTDGKNEGEWYPFFGVAGNWIVKGNVEEDGKMEYHPEVTKVQDLLNENLKLPAKYIGLHGKFGTGKILADGNPEKVIFDLNDYMKYQNPFISGTNETAANYSKRITGYNPEKVINDEMDPSSEIWVRDVVSRI